MWYSPEHLVAFSSLVLLSPTTLPHVGASAAAHVTICDAPTFALPSSVRLEPGLEPVVRWALTHSPTLRQQCRTILAEPALRASIRVRARVPGDEVRAKAMFRAAPGGGTIAEIELGSSSDLVELLGHELEHLIERLDAVDLPALVREGEARQLEGGAFETKRAIAAGQRVSGEVLDRSPDRIRRATGSMWRAVRRLLKTE
jgi:hypothetical protein